MRLTRIAIIVTTFVAWLVPSAVAMWVDVQRFVHPYVNAPAAGDYERDPGFQSLFFLLRFGWLLVLVLAAVLVVQFGILRQIGVAPRPTDAA